MKVSFVTTGLGTGGAEAMLSKILPTLVRRGVQCQVVSLLDQGKYGARLQEIGISVQVLRMSRALKPDVGGLTTLRRYVRNFDPHLLQGWMYHGNLAALAAGAWNGRRRPVLWGIRQSLYDISYEKPSTRLVIRTGATLSRLPAAVVYVTRLSRDQHIRAGFCESNATVIANGFDTERFRPDSGARLAARTRFGFGAGDVVIGHVARFHPMKDHETFLRAAAIARRSCPNLRFALAGTDVDTANRALVELVRREGLERDSVLLGEIGDVAQLMPGFDVFCLSSFAEGFPNVVGEACAAGVPCVVTAVGAAPHIVGECGLVTAPRAPDELAAALVSMASRDVEARRELGMKARERVIREFSLESVAGAYHELFQDSLGRMRSEPGYQGDQ